MGSGGSSPDPRPERRAPIAGDGSRLGSRSGAPYTRRREKSAMTAPRSAPRPKALTARRTSAGDGGSMPRMLAEAGRRSLRATLEIPRGGPDVLFEEPRDADAEVDGSLALEPGTRPFDEVLGI